MKSSYCNTVLLFVSVWLFPNRALAQIDMSVDEAEIFRIDEVTSSSFEMVLYPTPMELDTSATAKVTNIIKNQLLVSSSNPNSAFVVNAIDILVEDVVFDEDYELEETLPSSFTNNFTQYVNASLIEFKVVVGRYKQDTIFSLPSQFAVDNLVVRTFSQPSTKSNFIDLITQTMDPFLIEIEDIVINYLVPEGSNEKAVNERNAELSSIDIILIIISSGIFVGVLCILIPYYYKDGYEDIRDEAYTKGKDHEDEARKIGSNEVDRSRVPLEKILHEGNIVEAGSLESSIDSQSQNVLSILQESPVVSYATSSSSTSTSTSSSSSTSTCTSSTKKYIDKAEERVVSESMESEDRQDSKVPTVTKDDFTSKLLKLPDSGVYATKLKTNTVCSSVASAPTILEDIIGKWKNEESKNMRTLRSNRSTASPGRLKLNRKKRKATVISLHPTLKNRFVLNGFIMLGTTEEFHKSWLESQRKALEDIEEGSVDDVFQIDAQSNGDVHEKKEVAKRTLSTPVSEWMKLIRVVNSASETQSSLENSSTDPKAFQAKECCSVDLSLEDSLAKSSVDPELG